MTAPLPVEDGNLPAALRSLDAAVSALCDPRAALAGRSTCQACHNDTCEHDCKQHTCPGHTTWIPSWYLQLSDVVMGEQSNAGGGGGGKSRPPFWTDAHVLRDEIDTAAECWQPAFTGVPPTVGRLRCILARPWRPQDTRQIDQITAAVESWREAIDTLLNPPPKWTLPSPCPACETATVYRRDGAGEMVRQPALQLSKDGCTCQRCHYTWGPERFHILAATLGYPLAEGVLTLEADQ